MLQALLIYLSKLTWAQRFITRWDLAWRLATRFIAGETREDAVQAALALNSNGINATVDFLGENVKNLQEAELAASEVIATLEMIEASGAQANVSLKLSQMGLELDPARCQQILSDILATAARMNNFIRIDMEDSSLTQATLDMYAGLRALGHDNVGVVIQSYLYRSEQDIENLSVVGGHVRLCKGAYKEPPDIAFPRKQQVDDNFDRLVEALMRNAEKHGLPRLSVNGRVPPIPAIATHDPARIQFAQKTAKTRQLPTDAYEFQMLYGIRRDLQEQLVQSGYPVRVYIPYGTHWYPYFMRRLAERPANLWFFISSLFRR